MTYIADDLDNPDAVTLEDLDFGYKSAKATVAQGRSIVLHPNEQKKVPVFSITELANMFGVDQEQMRKRYFYLVSRDESMPKGWLKNASGELVPYDGSVKSKVVFRPDDLPKLIAGLYPSWTRPKGTQGIVITVCNFKGGVTKSTSSLTIAQGLSLRGLRVLLIDLDPQATMTKWSAIKPVGIGDTCANLYVNLKGDIKDLIQPTYWPGIDLIPSHDELQTAESSFASVIKQRQRSTIEFVPAQIRKLRADYDAIIIDTPPSLNHLTLSALFSSDGVVMPIVPSNPDVESAANFWKLYIDTCRVMQIDIKAELFQFARVLIAKTDKNQSNQNMIDWINKSYSHAIKVFKTTIPRAEAVSRSADAFGTVFDEVDETSRSKKFGRDQMRARYSGVVSELADLIYAAWRREEAKNLLSRKSS